MRILIALFIMLVIFLSGCTEKEEKEFTDALIKDAINQKIKELNPIKLPVKNTSLPSSTQKCNPLYDNKFSCEYVNYGYSVIKITCIDGIKQKTVLSSSYEYCNEYGEYTREYCDSYLLKEVKAEVNTICLNQNTQVGKEYCRAGQIKREITNCDSESTCVVRDGIGQCMKVPKKPGESPFVQCARDYRGRCPSNCVEYFGSCVYPP